MINLKTLFWYFVRSYVWYFCIILFLLIGILLISNIFDILQRYKHHYIPLPVFLQLLTYKVPYLLNQLASIVSFIAMLFFLRKLTKSNELLVAISSGVHFWQILLIPAIATLVLSIGFVMILNPIGAWGLNKYELLEVKIFNKKVHDVVISKAGLLFFEKQGAHNQIIQAQSVNLLENKLNNIVVLLIKNDNSFISRVDAKSAIIGNGVFSLEEARVAEGGEIKFYDNFNIPTRMSIGTLMSKFAAPETVSVWRLPFLIKDLLNSGVPVIDYKIYYYKQLLKPIMMISMVILASCFIDFDQRNNFQEKILIIALFIGFIVFSLTEILIKIFAYNNISLVVAVLLPSMLTIFISSFIISQYKQI